MNALARAGGSHARYHMLFSKSVVVVVVEAGNLIPRGRRVYTARNFTPNANWPDVGKFLRPSLDLEAREQIPLLQQMSGLLEAAACGWVAVGVYAQHTMYVRTVHTDPDKASPSVLDFFRGT